MRRRDGASLSRELRIEHPCAGVNLRLAASPLVSLAAGKKKKVREARKTAIRPNPNPRAGRPGGVSGYRRAWYESVS